MIYDTLEQFACYEKVLPHYEEAAAVVARVLRGEEPPVGRTDVSASLYTNVMAYDAKPREEGMFETHRDYIDIQILLSGRELFYTAPPALLTEVQDYDPETDCRFLTGEERTSVLLTPGAFVVVLPGEPHMPSIRSGEDTAVRKLVIKVRA